jgi:predicted Zn-dependent peptidase
MEIFNFTLPNGIRVVHQYIPGAVSHCGLFVNAGSRDEQDPEHGLAHFIEHVIFKGTKKRNLFQVLNRLEDIGADLNAYTSKEETCIYASFLNSYYERTLELISDICLNSTFPEKELEKEKVVVIDEIKSYKDTPSEQIFDDFEDMIFAGHPLGRNILGTPADVKRFHGKDILRFMANNYLPGELVIASTGNIQFRKLVTLVQKYFSEIQFNGKNQHRQTFNSYKPQQKSVKRRIYQTHCIIGIPAYSQKDDKKYTLAFLNNILGGPAMNSRLSIALREKNGITYHIESGYHAFSDTGIMTIYFGTDKRSLEKASDLVLRETEKLRHQKLGIIQMQRARKQLIGQLSIGQESNVNRMLTIGKSILTMNEYLPLESIVSKINAITPEQLMDTANEILDPDRLSKLVFLQSI